MQDLPVQSQFLEVLEKGTIEKKEIKKVRNPRLPIQSSFF